MKSLFILLVAAIIIISTTTSCSKEDIDQNSNLLGVWERGVLSATSTDTFTLVFGSGNTGLRIFKSVYNSGEEISTASGFNWKAIDNIVMILETDDVSEDDTFILNAEGKLVLSTLETLAFDKISDDYSKYY